MDFLIRLMQKKLSAPERCLCCVNCKLQEWAKVDCLLALVERSGDYCIFSYKRTNIPVQTPEDLVFENAFPVISNLDLKLDRSKEYINGVVNLTISGSTSTALFELPCDQQTDELLQGVQIAQSKIPQKGLPPSFSWLDKYRNPSKTRHRSLEFMNPAAVARDEFDPLKQSSTTDDSNKQADWPFSHIVSRPERTESCPVVYDNTVSTGLGFDDDFVDIKPTTVGNSMFTTSSSFSSKGSEEFVSSSLEKEISESLPGLTVSHFGVGVQNAVGHRDLHVRLVMKTKEAQFTDTKQIKVFCGTWNVNGQPATESLNPWLRSFQDDTPDVFAIGFQELDLSNQAFIFSDSPREQEWYRSVKAGLPHLTGGSKYSKLKLIRLVGMMLVIFIKEKFKEHVTDLSAETVGTGLMGTMGNKGGVAVRFKLFSTTFCFVNTHLAAHADEYERRNQDYREINSRMVFNKNDRTQTPLTISSHDIVFWIGDLNYRLMDLTVDKVKAAIDTTALESVLEFDQLRQQQKAQKVFVDYDEADIKFQPTYKYDVGTDNWDSSEKCRCPAWCDRILWRKSDSIRNLEYRNHMIHRLSDHKPVSSVFAVNVKVINKERYKKVYEEVMRTLDRLENEFLPQVNLDVTELEFGELTFIEPVQRYIILTNTGQVPAEFEFINKLDDDSCCKPWMDIKPFRSCILPGEKCEIEFEIYVNEQTVAKLNAGDDHIEDILVLHLQGGKDFFITASGKFVPSCFGSSIDALVNMDEPIRDVPVAQLITLEHINAESMAAEDKKHRPLDIPKELWRMVDHIYYKGIREENLFQQPGLHAEIRKIRDALDTGLPEVLPGSIHSVAEALLLFLDALPEPVIPYIVYDKCLECCSNFSSCKQKILELPVYHRKAFIYLMSFLRQLLKNSAHNGLEVDILATMFGGVILRAPPVKNNTQNSRANGAPRQLINRKKAAFLQHFMLNGALDLLPEDR